MAAAFRRRRLGCDREPQWPVLGEHRGGYDPFDFDITDALAAGGKQELVVSVWDPTDRGSQPRGKQVLKPGGIMYTANTGIWQTVWLEPVPEAHITGLTITPDVDRGEVRVTRDSGWTRSGRRPSWPASDGDREIGTASAPASSVLTIKVESAKLWSPDRPFLYDLRVGIEGGEEVRSLFRV